MRDLCGHFLDLLDEKLVVTQIAPDLLTGQLLRTLRAAEQLGQATTIRSASEPDLFKGPAWYSSELGVTAWSGPKARNLYSQCLQRT